MSRPMLTAWVARDKIGCLYVYFNQMPYKEGDIWEEASLEYAKLESDLFPSVRWEDEGPTEVEVILKPIEQ